MKNKIKVGNDYTWTNPYTNWVRTGKIVLVDDVQGYFKVDVNGEIFTLDSAVAKTVMINQERMKK